MDQGPSYDYGPLNEGQLKWAERMAGIPAYQAVWRTARPARGLQQPQELEEGEIVEGNDADVEPAEDAQSMLDRMMQQNQLLEQRMEKMLQQMEEMRQQMHLLQSSLNSGKRGGSNLTSSFGKVGTVADDRLVILR